MTRNEAVPNQPRAVLCRGTTKAGKPCRAIAGGGGLCAIHAGRVDPCAIGRSGGLARTRSQLGISPELADDQLRAQARRRLEALVNSDDERTALAAARALYSYGPQRPPAGEAQTEHQPIVQQYDEFAIVAMLEQVGLVRRCDLTLSDPQKVALLDAARASLEGGGPKNQVRPTRLRAKLRSQASWDHRPSEARAPIRVRRLPF